MQSDPNDRDEKNPDLNKIIAFAKRKGFVYPSSEIYGGFSAIYDYGPYGTELKNTVKRLWWKAMVQEREDIVGLDSSIFMSPQVWVASGHVAGFSDPLTECKNCHFRMRVDTALSEIGVFADEKMSIEEIQGLFSKNKNKIHCPSCGQCDFTETKKFNLLVSSNLGNFSDDWRKDPVYLRGETCQGIYVNYKNILDSVRVKIPFGVAQIGKAFRNEITARQFIFRTREFEQMEMQYFTSPDDEMNQYEKLRKYRWDYYINLGINPKNLRWHKHENLVFYAKEAYDVEYNFPFGFHELEGIHARGDYDLSQHSKASGVDMVYIDPGSKEKYIPHIIESSVGVDRTVLMFICEAYSEETVNGERRVLLKFSPDIAPIKVAVFPLLKNKPELVKQAKAIFDELKKNYMSEFDDNGNIGKRYRRQDEIGTPLCITVDFQTLEDKTVTVRDRDTMVQKRVTLNKLPEYLKKELNIASRDLKVPVIRHSLKDIRVISMRIKEILQSDLDPLKKIVWCENGKYFYTVSFYDSLDNSINICVSSQIGCTERCAFCATASYPFVKNLEQKALEEQYLQGLEVMADFKKKYQPRILFIILEGMGEPTRNLDNCLKALKNIYPKIERQFNEITFKISTIGHTDFIEKYIRFIKENAKSMSKVAFRFQISLHSSLDKERLILIPTINEEVSKIIKDFYKLSDFLGSKLLCNYMLLNYPDGGTNYSNEHLNKLVSIIIPEKTSIKLTRYSETGKGFSSPDNKVFQEVKKILESKGVEVEVRKLLGSDVNAACGMLHYQRD